MAISIAIAQFAAIALADPLPNIVYILADDMGLGEVRSYTANSPVDTPNLDRIANAGMRFTDAHALDSVCTLSRYGILTGQYGWRTSLQSGVLNGFSPPLLPNSGRLTVAEVLKQSGYSTGMFGKWHQGIGWVTTNGQAATTSGTNVDFSQPFTGGPIDHGFDTFFGIVSSAGEGPYAFVRDNRTVGPDLVTPTSPTGQVYGNPSDPVFNRLGPIAPGYDIRDTLPTVVNEATAFINQKANQINPFFAYIPITAPHDPIVPPNAATGQSGVTGPKQAYGDFLWSVDRMVGQILDKLADPDGDPNTADSILENTLVIFTADNGYASQFGFATSAGSIGGSPLRDAKASIYEGGTRVPFLAQWTGQIPAGTVNNHFVQLNDLMATAAGIIGYALPANSAEDSINIMPEFTGTAITPTRTAGITHSYNGAFAVRQVDNGNNEWKLIFTPGNGGYTDFQKVDPKATITDFTKLQLYNVTNDPGEQFNLLSGGGNPATQQKALQLQKVLQGYLYAGRSVNIPPRSQANDNVIQVDFGENSIKTNGNAWNNVAGAVGTRPVAALGLWDQGGGYTGIVLKTSWTAIGENPGGVASLNNLYNGPYPADVTGLPTSALSDGFYVRNGNKLTVTLESLDAHAMYDFLFYGVAAAVGPEYSLFTVTGSTSEQAHIAPILNNSTQVATVNGIMPNGLNTITIDFEGRFANGSVGGGGFLNFMRIVEHLLEIPGDYNNDRIVDAADYASWRSAFGTIGASAADGNHDGVVDAADFVIWRHAMVEWGSGAGSASDQVSSAVPEPASLFLAAIGLIGLLANRRRRRHVR